MYGQLLQRGGRFSLRDKAAVRLAALANSFEALWATG